MQFKDFSKTLHYQSFSVTQSLQFHWLSLINHAILWKIKFTPGKLHLQINLRREHDYSKAKTSCRIQVILLHSAFIHSILFTIVPIFNQLLIWSSILQFLLILQSFKATSLQLHTHRINRLDNKLNSVRTKSISLAKEFSKIMSLNLSILKIGIDVFFFGITRMRSYGKKLLFRWSRDQFWAKQRKRLHFSAVLGFEIGLWLWYDSGHWLRFQGLG